jgi:flagellar biosynthesis GTPase FlhF
LKKRTSMRNKIRRQAKEDAQKRNSFGYYKLPDGKDLKFLEIKKGTMNIDIVPFEVKQATNKEVNVGDLWWEKTFLLHRNIGSEQKAYVCPRTIGKPCPICEERTKLLAVDFSDERAKELKPQERMLLNVINRKGTDDILLFDYSMFLFGSVLLEEVRERDEEYAAFADLVGGYTVEARFKEEIFSNNKYYKCTRVDFIKREDYDEEILEEVYDLDDLLVIYPYKKLESLFLEVDSVDEEEEEEQEEQVEQKSTRRIRKTLQREEEDEVEFEEEEEEEEEQHKRENRFTKKKKVEPVPEEEQVEQKPRKRSSKQKNKNYECPEGADFGIDFDMLEECDECPLREPCEAKLNEDE